MKKALLGSAVALALIGGGLWLSMRRHPGGTILGDAPGAFQVEAAGGGLLIRLQAQVPLRALRWLGPFRGGLLAAQVLTQSDRQQVVFFRDGQPAGEVLVQKPFGVGEGFWRFAVLKDVAALPGGEAALLYAPGDEGGTDPAVVIAVDMAHGEVRWTHRGAFSRMVLTEGADPALLCYGGANPIQRLALSAARAGEAGRTGPNAAAKSLALPPEVPAVEDLLPTGGATFLVSHPKGLSAYRGSKGWTHVPAPADPGVPCAPWRSGLVRAGRAIWWQPWPGQLLAVHAARSRPRGKWRSPRTRIPWARTGGCFGWPDRMRRGCCGSPWPGQRPSRPRRPPRRLRRKPCRRRPRERHPPRWPPPWIGPPIRPMVWTGSTAGTPIGIAWNSWCGVRSGQG